MNRTLLLLMCGFVTACGGSQKSSESPPAATAAPESLVNRIVLLDPGSEPRSPIRYTMAKDQGQTIYVDLGTAAAAEVGQEVAEAVGPPVRFVIQVGAPEASAKDTVKRTIAMKEIQVLEPAGGLDPKVREDVLKELAPLLRVHGWVEVDSRGITRASDFEGIGPDIHPRLLTMLSNIRTGLVTVAFPEEPIGPGARWEVHRTMDVAAITGIEQKLTYTLGERGQDRIGLTLTGHQSAPQQPLGNGSLEAYESSILGSMDLKLNQLTPLAEAEAVTQLRAKMPNEKADTVPVQVETRTKVYVHPPTEDTDDGSS